MALIIELFS
ncbi:hypothetical protein LINGRAPRIM_LOCUS420 [Linum grandiflorum]